MPEMEHMSHNFSSEITSLDDVIYEKSLSKKISGLLKKTTTTTIKNSP